MGNIICNFNVNISCGVLRCFHYNSTCASFYIVFVGNGRVTKRYCGVVSIENSFRSVDITSAVTPGQTADVRVLVAAIADPELVGTFWQNAFMDVSYSAASLRSRG